MNGPNLLCSAPGGRGQDDLTMSGFDHLCFHGEGQHQCHCGIGYDHTTAFFREWHAARGVPVLHSQVA